MELSLVQHTIISLIRESLRLLISHLELYFSNSNTKPWKFWLFCCLYMKYLWQRMVVLFQGFQYSDNLGSSSPSSKVKVLYLSLPFWPMHARKWKSLLYHPWYLFPFLPNKNQSVWVKISSYKIHCCQMRKNEEVLPDRWFPKWEILLPLTSI